MSHTIVREFQFVALSGAHQGLVCELALCASSNVLDRSGRYVFAWKVGAVSDSLAVARALAADDVACGYLRGSRARALAKVHKMHAVEQDALCGPASVALALFLRDGLAGVEMHTERHLAQRVGEVFGGQGHFSLALAL